jgi:hypothetical protein
MTKDEAIEKALKTLEDCMNDGGFSLVDINPPHKKTRLRVTGRPDKVKDRCIINNVYPYINQAIGYLRYYAK